jgi:hypothetical protein
MTQWALIAIRNSSKSKVDSRRQGESDGQNDAN